MASWRANEPVHGDFLTGKQTVFEVEIDGSWVKYNKAEHGKFRSHAKRRKNEEKEFDVLSDLRDMSTKTRIVIDEDETKHVGFICI